MARIDKDHVDKFYDYDIDIPGRTIWVGSVSDEEGDETGTDYVMAERLVKGIYLLDRAAQQGDKPIRIIMSNPGGDVHDGLGIYDAIRACKNHVTIIGIGKVWSMGAYILQAADERVLTPNCSVMFHEGYDSYASNHPEIIRRWIKYGERAGDVLDKILLDKIHEKHPELKEKKFKEMNTFDTIMTAQEAIDFGLADRLIRDGELSEEMK